jgi:hypothetical protein
LAESLPSKQVVAGSSPVSRSTPNHTRGFESRLPLHSQPHPRVRVPSPAPYPLKKLYPGVSTVMVVPLPGVDSAVSVPPTN